MSETEHDHDRLVRSYAEFFATRGYEVHAVLPGYPEPGEIAGFRPDLLAVRSGHRVIIEVVLPEEISSEAAVLRANALRKHAQECRGQFIRAVTDGRKLK